MAVNTTFQKLAEKIINTYERGLPVDGVIWTQNHVSELIAEEIAAMATADALKNSQEGETTYANDQFISTYKNQSITFDSTLKKYYTPLPASPAAIPGNSSIIITPTGSSRIQIIMMRNRDRFAHSMLDNIPGVILAYVENLSLIHI